MLDCQSLIKGSRHLDRTNPLPTDYVLKGLSIHNRYNMDNNRCLLFISMQRFHQGQKAVGIISSKVRFFDERP